MTTASPLQRRLSIRVSHVNHPSSFYAQIGTLDQLRSFDRFASELCDWAKACSVGCTAFPDVGTYLLVKCNPERESVPWARAFVTEKLDVGIKVFLIDLGRTQNVLDVGEICGGCPMLLSMAQQALHCHLVDAQLSTDWSKEDIQRFNDCVFGEEKKELLLCTVYPQFNGKWPVAVFHREKDVWCLVGSSLGKFECISPPDLVEELAELNNFVVPEEPTKDASEEKDNEDDKVSICTQQSLSEDSDEVVSDCEAPPKNEDEQGTHNNAEDASKEPSIVRETADSERSNTRLSDNEQVQVQMSESDTPTLVSSDQQVVPSHNKHQQIKDLSSESDGNDANEWDDTLLDRRPNTPPITPPIIPNKRVHNVPPPQSKDTKQSSAESVNNNTGYSQYSADRSPSSDKSLPCPVSNVNSPSNQTKSYYRPPNNNNNNNPGTWRDDQASPNINFSKSRDNPGYGHGRKQWRRNVGPPPHIRKTQRATGNYYGGFGRGGGFMKTKPPVSEQTPLNNDQYFAPSFPIVNAPDQFVKKPYGMFPLPPTTSSLPSVPSSSSSSSSSAPAYGVLTEDALKNEEDWLAFKIDSEVKKILLSAVNSAIFISNLSSIINGATVDKLCRLKVNARPVGIVMRSMLNWVVDKLSPHQDGIVMAIHTLYVAHQDEVCVCLFEVFEEVFRNNCEKYSGSDASEKRQSFCSLLSNLLLSGLSVESTSFVKLVVECICKFLSSWTDHLTKKFTSQANQDSSSVVSVHCFCTLCESIGPSMDRKNREILDEYFTTLIPELITGDVLKQPLKLNLLNLVRKREQWLAQQERQQQWLAQQQQQHQQQHHQQQQHHHHQPINVVPGFKEYPLSPHFSASAAITTTTTTTAGYSSEPLYRRVSAMLDYLGLNELLDMFKSAKIQDSLLSADKHELKEVLKEAGIPPGAILSILKSNYSFSDHNIANVGNSPVNTSPLAIAPPPSPGVSPLFQVKGVFPNSLPDHSRALPQQQQRGPPRMIPGNPPPFFVNRSPPGNHLSVSQKFECGENPAPNEGLKSSVNQSAFTSGKIICVMCGSPDHRGYVCPRRRELVFGPPEDQ